MFVGYVMLDGTLALDFLADVAQAPADLDALPAFRVYGASGLMASGTGTATLAESGAISGATNAAPVVVTSAAHGLSTGQRVTVSGVGGNTAADGTWLVTVAGADTFALAGSTGNGAYTGGGAWHVTGLYSLQIDALAADGYEAGSTYFVLIVGALSSAAWGKLFSFVVG